MSEANYGLEGLGEYLDWLEEQGQRDRPIVIMDITVSRQFSLHACILPDQRTPTWHRWLEQALDRAQAAGYTELTLIVNSVQHTLVLGKD